MSYPDSGNLLPWQKSELRYILKEMSTRRPVSNATSSLSQVQHHGLKEQIFSQDCHLFPYLYLSFLIVSVFLQMCSQSSLHGLTKCRPYRAWPTCLTSERCQANSFKHTSDNSWHTMVSHCTRSYNRFPLSLHGDSLLMTILHCLGFMCPQCITLPAFKLNLILLFPARVSNLPGIIFIMLYSSSTFFFFF